MYCSHCGYKLDEHKVECKKSTYNINEEVYENEILDLNCNY